MSKFQRLKIKNFGPIKYGAKKPIEFKRCTVFIGDQGTGKSTLAKLFSIFTWLEKTIVAKKISNDKINLNDFKDLLFQQNIPKEYIVKETILIYESSALKVEIVDSKVVIQKKHYSMDDYICPKIQYVPSERNLLSVATNLQNISGLPEMLIQYNVEFNLANKNIKKIKFQNFEFVYDVKTDENYVITINRKSKISLSQASSGIQSIFPLLFVSKYQKNVLKNPFFERLKNSDFIRRENVISLIKDNKEKEIIKNYIMSGIIKDVKKIDLKSIEERFSSIINSSFIEIVEEPEQNLFPISQVELLKNLIIDTSNCGDMLILTTHSPYILSQLNNFIYAERVFKNSTKTVKGITKDMYLKFDEIAAYKIENGKVLDIMDNEYGGIDVTEIDECSRNINDEFDKLVMMENYDEEFD